MHGLTFVIVETLAIDVNLRESRDFAGPIPIDKLLWSDMLPLASRDRLSFHVTFDNHTGLRIEQEIDCLIVGWNSKDGHELPIDSWTDFLTDEGEEQGRFICAG